MPYIRTTVTISAAVHVDSLKGESQDDTVRRREEAFRDKLDENLKMLLAQARGPGGVITWQSKLDKEPKAEPPPAPEMPHLAPSTQAFDLAEPKPREVDPRVQQELDAMSQGRPPNGGLE